MKNIFVNIVPIFVVILSIPVSQVFAQADVLQWKFQKGDHFDVTLVQTSKAETKVDSRETSIDNSTTIVMAWNVTDVADGGAATIEQSIVSIELAVANPAIPAQAVKFDTSATADIVDEYSKSSKTLLKQIKPLIGLKFNVVMLPTGEIKSIELPPETATAINQLPETVRLRSLFSAKGIKEILGASAIILPTKSLDQGDSWTDEKEVATAFGKFNRNRTYSLVGKKTVDGDELAEIRIDAAMVPVSEAAAPGSALQGKLVSFSGSGNLYVDIENGFMKTSSFSNKLKTERPYREKQIETVVTNTIKMTLTKK